MPSLAVEPREDPSGDEGNQLVKVVDRQGGDVLALVMILKFAVLRQADFRIWITLG